MRLAISPGETSALARSRRVIVLALPIIGGMVSQNILNLVDTAMVGRTGTEALAAVSTGGMMNFMAVAIVMGLSSGVQAVAARRHGENRLGKTAAPLNGALLIAIAVGLPLTAVIVPIVPWLFARANPDPAVVAIGAPYLTARVLALTPAGVNFAFRGYWNGTNRSHLYMTSLLVVHASNIALNWILIFGHLGSPQYGAVGAGIASAVATALGTVCYVLLGLKYAGGNGFLRVLPTGDGLRTIVRLAVPSGLQQLLFAGGLTALFFIIGRLGTRETAAAGVLLNVMLVVILPGLALGITAASLVGQALGRTDYVDAKRWGWTVAGIAAFVGALLAVPMLVAPNWILTPFLRDAEAVDLARLPLQVFACGILLDLPGTVFQQALLGAGANRAVMLVSVLCQWVVFLPAAYLVGAVLGFGLVGIWTVQAGYRLLQAGIYAGMWNAGRWAKIKL